MAEQANEDAAESRPPARPRYPIIDVARGIALVAMASYHLCWDLSDARLIGDVAEAPALRAYAMAIAATFLFLSGLSQTLAFAGGVVWRRHVRRLAIIGAAAAAVSLASWYLFPDSWIYFGILHLMLVASLLAPGLHRLPVPLLLGLAAVIFAAPHVYYDPLFDARWLSVTGLADVPPSSNDFEPLLPWLAPFVLGVAAGRLLRAGRVRLPVAAPAARPLRLLAAAGRHSLAFYLIHQPLLFGLVALAAWALPVDPVAERAGFVGDCEASCTDYGAGAPYCTAFCGCVARSVDDDRIWTTRGPTPAYGRRIAEAAAICQTATPPAD